MKTLTKIIRAKSKNRFIEVPKEFENNDVRITFEQMFKSKIEQKEINKNLEDFEKLIKLLKKKNIQIPKHMDIDKIMNEMNDAVL